MSRFSRKSPKQYTSGSPLPPEPDPPQERVTREPGYVKYEGAYNYMSGLGSALSALVETWHRRKARRS